MKKLNELLTIAVPVKNEERNMNLCLENLRDFDNVVVIDSGSTDKTCEIASAHGREVVQFVWNGKFPKKRNWFIQNYSFKTPWVMFLDADERITEPWKNEAEKALNDCDGVDAFICYYDNWFIDRLLRHGDVMHKTAILRVGSGGYERIEEDHWSHLDMEIHEHLQVEGRIGSIKARLEHYDRRSLESYWKKHEEYADWEARRYCALEGDYSKLNKRQKVKYSLVGSWWFGFGYFIASYIFMLGFLDGRPGFVFSLWKMRYFTNVGRKLKELRAKAAPKRADVQNSVNDGKDEHVDLAKYQNNHGIRNMIVRLLWRIAWVFGASWTPRFALNRWRAFILRSFGARIGRNCRLNNTMEVWVPSRLFMGSQVWIDRNVNLYNVERITIEDNVIISDGVYICTASHDITRKDFALVTAPVTICAGAWIAAHARILPGVTIGEGAVVGSGAVVTKDVAPWTVVAGNPARFIKNRAIAE